MAENPKLNQARVGGVTYDFEDVYAARKTEMAEATATLEKLVEDVGDGLGGISFAVNEVDGGLDISVTVDN